MMQSAGNNYQQIVRLARFFWQSLQHSFVYAPALAAQLARVYCPHSMLAQASIHYNETKAQKMVAMPTVWHMQAPH